MPRPVATHNSADENHFRQQVADDLLNRIGEAVSRTRGGTAGGEAPVEDGGFAGEQKVSTTRRCESTITDVAVARTKSCVR